MVVCDSGLGGGGAGVLSPSLLSDEVDLGPGGSATGVGSSWVRASDGMRLSS